MISFFVSNFLLTASLFSFFSFEPFPAFSFFASPEEINLSSLAPIKKDPFSLGMVVSAKSAVIIDSASQAVLFEKEARSIRSIGSLTKLMSALVFLETHPNLSSPATFLLEDRETGGREIVAAQDVLTIHDFLLASLVSSDNSATRSLMRLSGMSSADFVAKMNILAKEWGMAQTFFVDPTGLS